MIADFRFGHFRNHILMTNDAGRFVFLTPNEFDLFIHDRLPHDCTLWQNLHDRFFCYEGSREVYLRGIQDAVRNNHAYLFTPTSLFIFALTNRCNNRCIYCQAQGNTSAHDMTPAVAERIVERIAESGIRQISIEFQGGEPLLNFAAIRQIVSSAETLLKDRAFDFSLVSNLAYMNDELADFIEEHHISVSTSLDGPRMLHDLNRPTADHRSSYDLMLRGLDLLQRRGISVGGIQTTTRASLPYAKEIVQRYRALGMNAVFLRPLTRLGAAARAWDTMGYTAEEFLRFYQEGLTEILRINKEGIFFPESHAAIFLAKLLGEVAPNYMELRSPCGAGIGQLAFTADGDVFTCDEGRMVAETGDTLFKLGNVYENGYNDWMNSSTCKAVCSSSLLETLPTCCDCVYQPYCGVCPVVNYCLEGCLRPKAPNNDRCRIYKGMIEILLEYFLQQDEETINIFKRWLY